jgi:hypothetical protein
MAAAGAWREAGLIDDAALATLAARHPEAGARFGEVWRALVFLCVIVGVASATGLGLFEFGLRDEFEVATVLLLCGAALAVVTDQLLERLAYRPSGAEAATSLLATVYLAAGVFVLVDGWHLHGRPAATVGFAWGACVFALASWRWGFRLYAGIAVLFALAVAAQAPAPRLACIAVAALLAAGAGVVLARGDRPPSHRDSLVLAQLVALAAVYFAVNSWSLDGRFIEEFGRAAGEPHARRGDLAGWLGAAGTALLPVAVLAWGLRSRRRELLDLGLVAAALSLVTLRHYVHVAPLWVVLAASGTALTGASLLIERWLRAGPGRERSGFTDVPLYDERLRERLAPLAAAASLAPGAGAPHGQAHGIEGGGGGFGGGGASGTF